MTKAATNRPNGTAAETTGGIGREVLIFLLLAFVILPIVMVGAISAYGFIVWFMQLWFWGPPT